VTAQVNVLIVDGDRDAREQAAVILGGFGFLIRQAESGGEALRLLREQERPMLLLVDARLPDMSGRELVAAALRMHPGLKVLLSDRFGTPPGGYPTLSKPYRFGPFIHAVREILMPA
jgi:CheY-like chemotaxis protein